MLRRASPDVDEDDPKPALMTPRRLATQLEGIYLELSRAGCRLQGVGCYVESTTANELVDHIAALGKRLGELRGKVLTGEVAIVKGLDEQAWRERRPLLAALEDVQSNGALSPSPIRRILELEEQFPDAVWGKWSEVKLDEIDVDLPIVAALESRGVHTCGEVMMYAKDGVHLYDLLDPDNPKAAAELADELADDLIHHFSAFTQGMPMPTKRAERAQAEAWPWFQILHASKGNLVLAHVRAPDPGSAIAMGRKRKACRGLSRNGFDCREAPAPVDPPNPRATSPRTPRGRSSAAPAGVGASNGKSS